LHTLASASKNGFVDFIGREGSGKESMFIYVANIIMLLIK